MTNTQACNACEGGTVVFKEGKGGAWSGRCGSCGAQVLVKSPAGVAKLTARLAGHAAKPDNLSAPKKDDLLKI